nr:MAG TPA: hypothetical protein [Caudoviricetes sp.]
MLVRNVDARTTSLRLRRLARCTSGNGRRPIRHLGLMTDMSLSDLSGKA